MMDDLAAALAARSLPQNLFGGAKRYTPSPLSRRRASCLTCLKGGCLAARPAWSAPPSPCNRIAQLARGGGGCCYVCFGGGAPPPPRPSPRLAGAGGFQLGFAHACQAAILGAGYAPPAWNCLQARHAPPPGLGREKRAPRFGLSLSRRCALPGLGRKPPCAFVLRPNPARCRVQPQRGMQLYCMRLYHAAPAAKAYQNSTKKHKKASKSPLFVRHIAASVPECVN